MFRFKSLVVSALPAVLLMSACATAPDSAPVTVADEAPTFQTYLAMRDFPVRTVPNLEGEAQAVISVGTSFTAKIDPDPALDWRYATFADGLAGFIFGMPFKKVEED